MIEIRTVFIPYFVVATISQAFDLPEGAKPISIQQDDEGYVLHYIFPVR